MHQYDYDHLPFIVCSEEHMVCGICRRTITHCPSCQGQILVYHQSVTKLIKTINNLRHKVQSLIEGDLFPPNNQKKSFDIILTVNKSVFSILTPAHLLDKFGKLFQHPDHLKVAKISMFAMAYRVEDSAFQYAFISNSSQLRNFLLFPAQEKSVQLVRTQIQDASLIVKALKEYTKKDCKRFILVAGSLKTDDCWFTMKNWATSRIKIRKCLLFCPTEEQKQMIGKDATEEVFTFQELGLELARIEATADFEVGYEQ